ncbi:hypothetical protein [Halorussus salinus]|uniref:hypothetical protein n=1 Tax=Halorussus salinus TaxID=1364935 RepID=UPI001091D4FF|nr:hypothetical protein [Halorussus salinus]
MTQQNTISRRSVLRKGAIATGAVVSGGTTAVGNAVAQDEQTGLAAKIESHGHYAWFPMGPESWGRSTIPYDTRNGNSRWMAEPQSDGSVRILAENLGTEPPNRNTGFDVHLGQLGTIETVTVASRTLQTPRTTGPSVLFLGLYLNRDGNADFFEWETTNGIDRWVGFGGDAEGLLASAASGEVTIDGDTMFTVVPAETQATLAELQDGAVEGIAGETTAALYVGVANGGEGTDEVVVEDVRVQRS